MATNSSFKFMLLASAALAVSSAAGSAFAQAQPAEETSVEEVVVTGTSIRGAAPVGSQPILIGRAEIEASTATTSEQIIREIPQIFNFGVTDSTRRQGGANITFGNAINIRGISQTATLTLINGRRAITQGTTGAAVDPALIPAIALQRIEVIADGASAVYGSDAITGVANLIVRRSYEGVGLDASYGFADDYSTHTVNAIVGKTWESGRFTLSAQHAYRSRLAGADREFYMADLRSRGGTDYRATQCNPGNIQIGTTFYAIPAGGATPANLVAGTRNLCDTFKDTDLLPRRNLNSAFLTFDQDVTDRIHLFVDGLYSERKGYRESGIAVQNLTVPATNPFFVAPAGATLPACPATVAAPAGTRCLTIQYAFDPFFDPATSRFTTDVWQVTGGFDIDLPWEWNLNVYTTYGRNEDHAADRGRAVNGANVDAALASTNRATAFNPFGTSVNSQAVIDSIFNWYLDTFGITKYSDSGAKLDGALFNLPGGEVKAAIGAEHQWFSNYGGQIRGPLGAQVGSTPTYSRKVNSAYVELLVPIFGDGNRSPGFESLVINLGARYDDYSDVGSTTNPKVGVDWIPLEGLKLHASYGTSFRAPLLSELHSAGGNSVGVGTTFDPRANNGAGANVRSLTIVTADNTHLGPETVTNWSFGVDYSPAFYPRAQLALNYFHLRYEDRIAAPANILAREALFPERVVRGAAVGDLARSYIARGWPVIGSLTEILAAPLYVDGRAANMSISVASGLDFSLVAPFTVDSVGDFRATIRGSRFFEYKTAESALAPFLNQLDTVSNPQKWRVRAGLGWTGGPVNADLFVNHASSYLNDVSVPTHRIKASTTVDLAASYDLGEVFGVAKDTRVGIDITNLFDTDPPFANLGPGANVNGGGFDPQVASAIGRMIAVSVRTRF